MAWDNKLIIIVIFFFLGLFQVFFFVSWQSQLKKYACDCNQTQTQFVDRHNYDNPPKKEPEQQKNVDIHEEYEEHRELTETDEDLFENYQKSKTLTDKWWTANSGSFSDEPFRETGWFPEKNINAEIDKDLAQGNNSFFRKCLTEVYSKSWEKNPQYVFDDLVKWITLDPVAEMDLTCLPPKLLNPAALNCPERYPDAGFDNKTRDKPRKLAITIQYGFEVDILEMYLMEVYDVVDKFFITESIRSHKSIKPKYLMWEYLKWTPRFRRFSDKVVHLILDDSLFLDPRDENKESNDQKRKKMWESERLQERIRFERFMEWNEKHKYFSDDDMVSFGDADEIPSRHVLHALKYCNPSNEFAQIDIGTFYLNKHIRSALKNDFPVPGHPYNLGEPTFYTVAHCKKIQNESKWASRNKGRSGHFMLGGTHATYYPYHPQYFLKEFSCTECHASMKWIEPFFDPKVVYNDALKHFMTTHVGSRGNQGDVRGTFDDDTEYYPWIVKCNPLRYKPFVFFLPDDRLFLSKEELPFDTC